MEFNLLNNLAIVILSFAGFIAGMILSKIKSIQEELKPGKKYFIKLKHSMSPYLMMVDYWILLPNKSFMVLKERIKMRS